MIKLTLERGEGWKEVRNKKGHDWALVSWPKMNKQHSYKENRASIVEGLLEGRLPEVARVVRRIQVEPWLWHDFKDTMLDDRDEWFRAIGGSESESQKLKGVGFAAISQDINKRIEWDKTSYTRVVEILVNEGARCYVNTEGHKYARYVGEVTKGREHNPSYIDYT